MERIVDRGRLGQAGEKGRFGQGQLARMLGKVRLRRGLDAVRVGPVVDRVHVLIEDPGLRMGVAQLHREADLLDLPPEGALPRDVEVADELLRDRRTALDDVTCLEIRPESARDPDVVDPAVLIETAVLDRHGRLDQVRTDLVELHRLAILLGRDRAEERAVRRVDERVLPDQDQLMRVDMELHGTNS